MPIWFEIIALMLVAYLVGLTIGWAFWGRAAPVAPEETKDEE